MYKLVVIGTVIAVASAQTLHPVRDEIISQIKAKASTWTPMSKEENPFHTKTVEHIAGLLSTQIDNNTAPKESFETLEPTYASPAEYDPRHDKERKDCIHEIRDQAQCGSCWAFGATEALSDRFCWQKGVEVILSPQDLVSCEGFPQQGCNGGYLNFAWSYLKNTGVVTDDCTPYTSQTGAAPKCKSTCEDGSGKQKYKCSNTWNSGNQQAIKDELYTNGPVETGFTVYEDFMNYKNGIYAYTTGKQLGGHAVKIIGYGLDKDSKPYWICANSWSTKWGEQGFFNIYFGQVGIDQDVYGCQVAAAPTNEFEQFLQ